MQRNSGRTESLKIGNQRIYKKSPGKNGGDRHGGIGGLRNQNGVGRTAGRTIYVGQILQRKFFDAKTISYFWRNVICLLNLKNYEDEKI